MTNEEIDENLIQGLLIRPHTPVKIKNIKSLNINKSKAIDSKQWGALPPEAQKALKDQGFYPIIEITC